MVRTLDSHPKATPCVLGKPLYVVMGPQALCEVRIDHVAPLHTLLAKKEGRIWFNIMGLKLYQFKGIIWWCLWVLEYVMKSVMKFVMLEKILKKFMVSRNFRQTHLLEVGLAQIPVDHAPLFVVRHVGLHVDFSSTNFFLDLKAYTS